MLEDVKKILALLREKDENNNLEVSFFDNPIEKWAFILSGIFAIAFICTSFFEKTIKISFWLFIIWFILLLVYYLSKIAHSIYIIFKPVNAYLSILDKKNRKGREIIKSIS